MSEKTDETPIEEENINPEELEDQDLDEEELDEEPAPSEEEPPAYEVKGTYRYLDQDYEFDPLLKDAIKTEEDEKLIHELYTRSKGLDLLKEKNEGFKTRISELEPYQEEATQYKQRFEYLTDIMQKDPHRFFREIGMDDNKVLETAMKIVEYQDLTPDQKQAYDNNIVAQQNAYQMQMQNQQLQHQVSQVEQQQHSQLLDYALGDPSISEAVQSFNSRMGSPDAFKQEVIRLAAAHEETTRRNGKIESWTPKQAVDHLIKVIGYTPQGQPQPQQTENQHQGNNPPANNTVVVKKPVVPKVPSSNASHVKTKVKSLADIAKRAEELEAQGL